MLGISPSNHDTMMGSISYLARCDSYYHLHVHQNTQKESKRKIIKNRQQESKNVKERLLSWYEWLDSYGCLTLTLSLEQGRQAFLHIGLGRHGSLRL